MGVTLRQKNNDGKWWVFISYRNKRKSTMVGDKATALKVARELRTRIKLGEFDWRGNNNNESTFKEYAESWISVTAPAELKESTLDDYRDILDKHVLPVFGDLKLSEITKGKIRDFLAEKSNNGYAKSTVMHMRNVISNVLNKAVEYEVIPQNPARNLGNKIGRKKDHKEDINPLTRDECKLLLDAVKVHFSEYYTLFLLLIRTGMRVGEALALQTGDIDFNARFITVSRGLSRGRVETPKSGKSRRVDMTPQLADALKAQMAENNKKGMKLGLGGSPEYLFTNEKGGFIDLNNWRRRVFNKVLKKAGLRKIRVHDLRHSYATIRISKGDSILDVSNQLGHHSTRLTLDTYSHWLPGKNKAEVDALDDTEYRERQKASR
jgi:integrase